METKLCPSCLEKWVGLPEGGYLPKSPKPIVGLPNRHRHVMMPWAWSMMHFWATRDIFENGTLVHNVLEPQSFEKASHRFFRYCLY